jgi:glycosyltransferase involved in cell wall biosynthesis
MASFLPATINTISKNPMKGIYYIGQYGTSGYASAAKGYLYHYFSTGVPITWEPLYFDDSKMGNDDPYNIIVKSLIDKPIPSYDVVIMHCTPDLWPIFRDEKRAKIDGKIVIGYCAWETDKLPDEWIKCINSTVHEVWVPSKYNAENFLKCGVERTIRVVPHIFLQKPLPSKDQIQIINLSEVGKTQDDYYTFYAIGELNARKGIDDLLNAFCSEFSGANQVRLILKVHYKDYSPENIQKCKTEINKIISQYENPPLVICITENMKTENMLALHAIGDCYVSLTKSEGFGLTIFDAFNYGKRIIATGYSGHMDFLGENHPGLVKYTIAPVSGMESATYGSDQNWAIPDLDHAKELMRKEYEKYRCNES